MRVCVYSKCLSVNKFIHLFGSIPRNKISVLNSIEYIYF